MQRLIITTISLFYSCFALAQPNYQIDLILFTHSTTASSETILDNDAPLIPLHPKTVVLQSTSEKTAKNYCLLPRAASTLKDQYYQLNRSSAYQILGSYSWKQPANNQATVALPFIDDKGWQIQGTLQVKQKNYYHLYAELQVSSPKHPQTFVRVVQNQRLQNKIIYYLDNEEVSMLVKIQSIA